MDPTQSVPEIRRLPSSFSEGDFGASAPVARNVLARSPAAVQIIPFPPVAVTDVANGAVRILEANPNRTAVILRGSDAGINIVYGGPDSRTPQIGAGLLDKGIKAYGTESLTLETTDEIWAMASGLGSVVSGLEMVSNVRQP